MKYLMESPNLLTVSDAKIIEPYIARGGVHEEA
jgi:hypothetical protein